MGCSKVFLMNGHEYLSMQIPNYFRYAGSCTKKVLHGNAHIKLLSVLIQRSTPEQNALNLSVILLCVL